MKRIARFEKVSQKRFVEDWLKAFPKEKEEQAVLIYQGLKQPQRATRGSAGYDFFSPLDFALAPQESIQIPTGMRVKIEPGWVLALFPRSGLGFKYRLQLNNTVGIIDSDYYGSDNEGHLFIKLTNDSLEGKSVQIQAGEGIVQGIFLPFGITEEDACEEVRNGGFGSTTKGK